MQPPKAAHAMEAGGQDMLEEAAEELEGLQVNMLPGAGAAVSKRPAQPSLGQELDLAVAGSRLEHVAAQVGKGVLAAAHGGAVDYPALLPGLDRDFRQGFGALLLECRAERIKECRERGGEIIPDFRLHQ